MKQGLRYADKDGPLREEVARAREKVVQSQVEARKLKAITDNVRCPFMHGDPCMRESCGGWDSGIGCPLQALHMIARSIKK